MANNMMQKTKQIIIIIMAFASSITIDAQNEVIGGFVKKDGTESGTRSSPLDNEKNEGWASAHLRLFLCLSTIFEENNYLSPVCLED